MRCVRVPPPLSRIHLAYAYLTPAVTPAELEAQPAIPPFETCTARRLRVRPPPHPKSLASS